MSKNPLDISQLTVDSFETSANRLPSGGQGTACWETCANDPTSDPAADTCGDGCA